MSNNQIQTGSLNVQADANSIYEGGNLLPVSIGDLNGNEVAIRQLINTLNLSHKENARARNTIEQLRISVASLSLQPFVSIILGITNISGAVLIGFGTNYLSSSEPPSGATWVLGVGIALTIVGAALPPFVPVILKQSRSM